MMDGNDSSILNIEPWFIPFDILNLICLTSVVVFAALFFFIILLDRTCHTVPMMLIANSCLAALLCACDILWITIITLINDLKRSDQQDILCVFRGYLTYVSCAIINYSFLLQSFYRYVIVVYPARLFWQSQRNQLLLIVITWIYAFLFPIAFIFTGDITYSIDNQICQIPFRLSFAINFAALCIYVIPISVTLFIYYKLVRYVRGMNQRIIPTSTLVRARRELKMFRRTVTILMILFTIDFPYALFIFMSFFNKAPQYHFRIAYIFINFGLFCVTIALFQFTDPLKTVIMKKLHIQVEAPTPARQ